MAGLCSQFACIPQAVRTALWASDGFTRRVSDIAFSGACPQGNFALPQKTVAEICQLPYEKVYMREQIQPGIRMHGPAMITEEVATTWLAEGWSAQCDEVGNLILSRTI